MSARETTGFLAGAWDRSTKKYAELQDKFSGDTVALVGQTTKENVEITVSRLVRSQRENILPVRERAEVLLRASQGIVARRGELIALVQVDTGFALNDAIKEVDRTAETLVLCAEEAKRLAGHVVPIEGAPNTRARLSYTKHEPFGLVCALTPFNSPLNTVAHKIGPAIAAGNSVLLKPASLTPLSAGILIEILLEAGLPEDKIGLVYGAGSEMGSWLAEQKSISYYAFTGSTEVGRQLHKSVGMRRTQLEMGSLASTIVCEDADLLVAARAITAGALRKSGQVCTSVQRVYAHRSIRDELTYLIAEQMQLEKAGDHRDEATTLGPLITPREAERVKSWIDEAIDAGGVLRHGGSRQGSVVEPTLLIDVPENTNVVQCELFGPAVAVQKYEDLRIAIDKVNATPYGLAAGIFTNNLSSSFEAIERLEVGNLYINQTSSSRADLMPFGGQKESGFGGSEGPRYAIEDMSRVKTITFSR